MDNSDLNPLQSSDENKALVESKTEDSSSSRISNKRGEDLDYARETYLSLIARNQEALDVMSNLAAELESPRMFEVLSQSIKSTAEIVDRVVELHQSDKKLNDSSGSNKTDENPNKGLTNNNLFIGSTEEFQRLLKQEKQSSSTIINKETEED